MESDVLSDRKLLIPIVQMLSVNSHAQLC